MTISPGPLVGANFVALAVLEFVSAQTCEALGFGVGANLCVRLPKIINNHNDYDSTFLALTVATFDTIPNTRYRNRLLGRFLLKSLRRACLMYW